MYPEDDALLVLAAQRDNNNPDSKLVADLSADLNAWALAWSVTGRDGFRPLSEKVDAERTRELPLLKVCGSDVPEVVLLKGILHRAADVLVVAKKYAEDKGMLDKETGAWSY